MTLKEKALTAYPIHAVILNFSSCCRGWLIENRNSVVWFLPAGITASRECAFSENVTLIPWFTAGSTVEV